MRVWKSIAFVLMPCCLTAALTGMPAFSQGEEPAREETLDPAIAETLPTRIEHPSPASCDELYTETILKHGRIDPLLEELERLSSDDEAADSLRMRTEHMRGLVLKRRGDFEDALAIFEDLCTVEDPESQQPQAPDLLQKAQLLDALGREEASREAWEQLLPLISEEELETRIRLRQALLRVEPENEEEHALVTFAGQEGRDLALRNRAAVVLGLIGRPADAIELYAIDETSEKRFTQEVRVAEWAIEAEDAKGAQEHAWEAVFCSKLKRDRHYGLTILIEAHRLDDTLDALIDKFKLKPELDNIVRSAWIGLLRERERYDEAIELFRESSGSSFTIEMRRELLDMYRESGDEEVMLSVYRELIDDEPVEVEWREGLSRVYLEKGDRPSGQQVWRSFLDDPGTLGRRLESAQSLMDLGLDRLAIEAAESCIEARKQPYAALIFLFGLHHDRGQLDLAEAALVRMGKMAPAEAAERIQLADAWERLDRQAMAVDVLEGVRAARGAAESGEDLEMRLAWLYSVIGEEEIALDRWQELWRKINSIARRRYAEDRMMTVAARLGTLADIAIELERKLVDGRADERESGLLVRLYTKVGDPVSAAEVIDEFLEQSGGSVVDSLQEKARVYLSCNDYHNYEQVVRQLIELDPEGEGDYLRQLAMSQLERGKPKEARKVLVHLKEIEAGTDSMEFEAGVLALAGLREEAIESYRRGIALNPGRIESYLLMANLMKELGRTERAIGMFQHLAETAEQDDLFTIAIDGLLNLEAPEHVMEWAQRVTLERLAQRHDKTYLYQLLADLAEQVDDSEGMLVALENSLSIAGERRPSVLRELMDIAKGRSSSPFGRASEAVSSEKHLAYGRRLIGLAEIVPPQVYLDLGEAFLNNGEADNATKTFARASDLPDYPNFQRQSAGLFEQAGFRDEALMLYKRVLVARSSDVGLMVKVGELEEQAGRDSTALELYSRALELLFSRQPLTTVEVEEEAKLDSIFAWYGARNIDDFDKHYNRLLKSLLVVMNDGEGADAMMEAQLSAIEADLERMRSERELRDIELADGRDSLQRRTLAHHPRIRVRASFYRRLAIAYEKTDFADELDLKLLEAFPEDKDLLERLCQERVRWGLYGSIRILLERAQRAEEERAKLRFLVGEGLEERSARRLHLEQAQGLILPLLISDKSNQASTLIRRTDFARVTKEELGSIEPLFSASIFLQDDGLTLQVAREWLRLHVKHKSSEYEVEPVLQKCHNALSPENYRNLCMSFTDDVLAKPEETSGFLTLLPKLQKEFEEPLVTEDQVMDLLDDYADGGWGFGLGPVITLLPRDKRGTAMRTIWAKVKPTIRAQFLFELVADADEELGDSVIEFIEGVFDECLKEENRLNYYYVRRLVDAKHNHTLALWMLDTMIERKPEDWVAKAARAMKLLLLDRTDEALEQGLEVFVGLIDNDLSDYTLRMARDQVYVKFLPEHLDMFLSEMDRLVEEQGESVEFVLKRVELLKRGERSSEARDVIAAAMDDFPKEIKIIEMSRKEARSQGLHLETVEMLERLVELDEEKLPQLFGAWRNLGQPVKALAVKEQLIQLEDKDKVSTDSGIPGFPGVSFPIGAVVMTPTGTFTAGGGGSGKKAADDRPTMRKVKDAVKEEEWETARTVFRRFWRKFSKGEEKSRGSLIYFMGGRSGAQKTLAWPPDKKEVSKEDKEIPRGGLDGWTDEEPEESQPPTNAYEVLAEHEFGVTEMSRLLRSKTARELDGARDLFMGILRARVLSVGEESAFELMMDSLSSGRAGKIDTTMLLTMLDEHPELQSEGTDELLGDLIQSVRPTDIGPLRSLARVHARMGKRDQARRLYSWCATRTKGSGFYSFGATATISAAELVKEVKEQLDGDDRLAVIEAIIDFSNPGDYSWARENFDILILETFMELLDPPAALERCREIVEEATDFKDGMRRKTAKESAILWAQNGEVESALECLEYGICSLDESVVEGDAGYWSSPTLPGFWSVRDIRHLFPLDSSAFADPSAWYLAAAGALQDWMVTDRVRQDQAIQALVILSLRLQAVGETQQANDVLAFLIERDEIPAKYELWLADAARELGDEDLADVIERRLYAEGRLHLERIHEVVSRELESVGPLAALELGEPALAYTLNPRLLEVLVDAAGRTGDTELAASWEARKLEAEEAEKRLKEIAKEELRKAKEEKAGSGS